MQSHSLNMKGCGGEAARPDAEVKAEMLLPPLPPYLQVSQLLICHCHQKQHSFLSPPGRSAPGWLLYTESRFACETSVPLLAGGRRLYSLLFPSKQYIAASPSLLREAPRLTVPKPSPSEGAVAELRARHRGRSCSLKAERSALETALPYPPLEECGALGPLCSRGVCVLGPLGPRPPRQKTKEFPSTRSSPLPRLCGIKEALPLFISKYL